MPALGFIAIVASLIRLVRLLWHRKIVRGLLLLTLLTIFIGTVVFYRFEPSITTWVDAYYFTVMTLTTIGYGDLTPTVPVMKLFTTLYVFIGVGIIAGFIGVIAEAIIEDAHEHIEETDER